MSKLINKPIELASYGQLVEVAIVDNKISIIGPLGSRTLTIPNELEIAHISETLHITRALTSTKEQRQSTQSSIVKALGGTFRSNILNVLEGLTVGFYVELKIIGVGYRVEQIDRTLKFRIGYSNEIVFKIDDDVVIECPTSDSITIFGTCKEKVTQIASKIRHLKKIDRYKGKGIFYIDEQIKLKEGKKQ